MRVGGPPQAKAQGDGGAADGREVGHGSGLGKLYIPRINSVKARFPAYLPQQHEKGRLASYDQASMHGNDRLGTGVNPIPAIGEVEGQSEVYPGQVDKLDGKFQHLNPTQIPITATLPGSSTNGRGLTQRLDQRRKKNKTPNTFETRHRQQQCC